MNRRLCIELHDVSPATWPHCQRLLDLVDALGRPPLTLLAIPNHHGRAPLRAAPAVVRGLRRRVDAGDEIVLHGYFHRDDGSAPRSPLAWLQRRVLTAGEGEFAVLARAEAARRIALGASELSALFGTVRGFVAPAWLSSEGTWQALRATPLRYAATRRALVPLAGGAAVAAPALTVSARSRWRRAASRLWLGALQRTTAPQPLLRIALHPLDAEHSSTFDAWRRALRALLDQREALTISRALALA